ncbi:MAG TPA: Hg(II)-responsive transcriptional regulator [Betaproteobacteria bacterium]|nr:Hg(II)-responsive transcriptional regulator [Betaproteobacteria bacterium]
MDKPLTIGVLARLARVNVETIRYYERRGLLQQPRKPAGGFRFYPPESIDRVRFIKRAQGLGFTLEEVTPLLLLDEGVHCTQARRLAVSKLGEIEAKLADLARMRDVLTALVSACGDGNIQGACPIIASLAHGRPVSLAVEPDMRTVD